MKLVELQPFTRADLPRLIAWIPSREFCMTWSGPSLSWPLDATKFERFLAEAEGDEPARRIFRAVETASGEVVGHVELAGIDRVNRSARLGRVLIGDERRRDQGLGGAMVEAALGVGFEELRLHRVSLLVFDFNTPALRCYERLGFVREGTLREARKVGDEYWNAVSMSLLESEWRVRAQR